MKKVIGILILSLMVAGCGNSYSPEHYFKSYVNDTIPVSVKKLKAKYSGFPAGDIVINFEISTEDLLSLKVVKDLNEVSIEVFNKFLANFGLQATDWQGYDVFYTKHTEAQGASHEHVWALAWDSHSHQAMFYLR